jgi:hypothetical protein
MKGAAPYAIPADSASAFRLPWIRIEDDVNVIPDYDFERIELPLGLEHLKIMIIFLSVEIKNEVNLL